MSATDLVKLSIADTTAGSEQINAMSPAEVAELSIDDVPEASEEINDISATDLVKLSITDTAEEAEPLEISDVSVITSYSWLNTAPPTVKVIPKIAVPGSPARWIGHDNARELKPETVNRWIDQHTGRCADSPFEPGIRAVLHQVPDYDFTSLQLIADSKELVQLLELACNRTPGNEKGAFEFGAQVIGNTVLFLPTGEPRWIKERGFNGFKKSFDDEYLQYGTGLEGSQQHFRIITWQIGDLKVMLRYSADGYLSALANGTHDEAAGYDTMRITKQRAGNILIESKGKLIPHESIIELNTRARHEPSDKAVAGTKIKTNLREAWLAQSHHYVVAVYTHNKAANGRPSLRSTASFEPSDIIFKNKAEIFKESGMEDEKAVRAFYELVEKLLKALREAAVEGKVDKFVVKYGGGDVDVVVELYEGVKGLTGELLERVKGTASWFEI